MYVNAARQANGTKVCLSTSSNTLYPAQHIIDGNTNTFYCTTGAFPQEFILSFSHTINITNIKLTSANIKTLLLYRTVKDRPTNWELVKQYKFTADEKSFQEEIMELQAVTATHLRFLISDGFNNFVAVYDLEISSKAVSSTL